MRQKNSQTGECLKGKYFWTRNMVLVDTISRESIHQVINHLIEADEFFQIFKLQ
ncbi:hypothetical protein OCK74_08110 [Chitinophagaceae bacterium LB-8]|uniref:Uncharacterized protein n=1 Tax=Paraflavisolibacter caeni TaxID=2982496 RepID=A0A9X2XUE4_9BACT|nr:hypothetical protein [Paraflavisolibacter caeni]MCU7549075.1 hypothetical protein [Paraflavisolibacter caeni]